MEELINKAVELLHSCKNDPEITEEELKEINDVVSELINAIKEEYE